LQSIVRRKIENSYGSWSLSHAALLLIRVPFPSIGKFFRFFLTYRKSSRILAPDYVTRRFNGSSAGLKKPEGLDLRWAAA